MVVSPLAYKALSSRLGKERRKKGRKERILRAEEVGGYIGKTILGFRLEQRKIASRAEDRKITFKENFSE